jgi:hypothetical protein
LLFAIVSCIKKKIKTYDKKVHPRKFGGGELVLKKIMLILGEEKRKWVPNYEGPYVVKKTFSRGSLILARMDEEKFPKELRFYKEILSVKVHFSSQLIK